MAPTIDEIMGRLPGAFDPARAQGLKANVLFDFTSDGGKKYVVHIADGACTVEEGEVPNPDAAILDCLRSAMDHLLLKNVYKRVEKQPTASYPEPTLFVDLRLTALRMVSSTTRMWTGVMSGRSYIKVLVKLTTVEA